MMKMVDEVIRDNDLPYQVKRIFEPPDQSWTWCAECVDPKAADAHHTFRFCSVAEGFSSMNPSRPISRVSSWRTVKR